MRKRTKNTVSMQKVYVFYGKINGKEILYVFLQNLFLFLALCYKIDLVYLNNVRNLFFWLI